MKLPSVHYLRTHGWTRDRERRCWIHPDLAPRGVPLIRAKHLARRLMLAELEDAMFIDMLRQHPAVTVVRIKL